MESDFLGVIDQHNGTVRVYQTPHKDKTYQKSVELIRALSKVSALLRSHRANINDDLFQAVDAIYSKAGPLLK